MKAITLKAEVREIVGKKVKKLRQQGELPVSVYGQNVTSVSLIVPAAEFGKIYRQTGETGLVELKFADKSLHTLIADVQRHPVTHDILHVQFHAVKLTEKIKAPVPVELMGESPAVQNAVGILLQTINEVEVEALPTDLPEKIAVGVETLTEIGQQITVGELRIPDGVKVVTNKEEVVVRVAPAVSAAAKKEAEEEMAKKAAEQAVKEAPPAGGATPTPGEEIPPAGETPAKETKTEASS